MHQTYKVVFLLFDGHLTAFFDATKLPQFLVLPRYSLPVQQLGSNYICNPKLTSSVIAKRLISLVEFLVFRYLYREKNPGKVPDLIDLVVQLNILLGNIIAQK